MSAPGAPLYSDKWPNSKVARIVALAAKGYSSPAIAAQINDGTTPNQVARMLSFWGVIEKSADPRSSYVDVAVPLAAKFRTKLATEASQRGMEMPELLQKVAETLCRDQLFGAVLDG